MAENRGRPLKFKSVAELQKKIDEYFSKTGWVKREVYDKRKQEVVEILAYDPPTITGLAIALDTSRKVLCEYEDREDYGNAIKKAKAQCEYALEYGALINAVNPTMAIFSAKNNYDWKDKTEVDQTIKGSLGISKLLDEAAKE